MIITYEKLKDLIDAVNQVSVLSYKDKIEIKDVLTKYMHRLSRQLQKHKDIYDELCEDVDYLYCVKNERSAIVYDRFKNIEVTSEMMKERREEKKKIMQKEIEIEPCVCPDLTRVNDLPLWVLENLNGVLFQIEIE